MIDRIEAHVAVTRAGKQRQGVQRKPFRLRVRILIADRVVFVAAQIAQRAVVVDEALARLLLAIVGGADRQGQRPAGGGDARRRAKVDAGEVAVTDR